MAVPDSKACSVCALVKPATDFSPDRRATTGLQPRCRCCSRTANKARRDANLDEAREKERARYKISGHKTRASNDAWKARNLDKVLAGKKRWYERVRDTPEYQEYIKHRTALTKDQKREYDKAYRQRDPTKHAARAKQWRKANPEKRRAIIFAYDAKRRAQTEGGVGGRDLARWTAAQPKRCYWCDADCRKAFHVDHYQPLARGGAHELHNLVIACPSCNLKKNAKDPLDFAKEVGRLL